MFVGRLFEKNAIASASPSDNSSTSPQASPSATPSTSPSANPSVSPSASPYRPNAPLKIAIKADSMPHQLCYFLIPSIPKDLVGPPGLDDWGGEEEIIIKRKKKSFLNKYRTVLRTSTPKHESILKTSCDVLRSIEKVVRLPLCRDPLLLSGGLREVGLVVLLLLLLLLWLMLLLLLRLQLLLP